jgi:signal transduction histidine kinase
MNSTLALNDLFEIVAKKARQIIGAHFSGISLVMDESLSPSIQHVSVSEKYEGRQSKEMSAEDFLMLFENVPSYNRLATSLVERDGRPMGLIQLADKLDGRFTENDEAILEQLAQMASTAIANVQLFEQVNANRDRLESLSRRLVEVQEGERRHIARELHDEVGQSLTGLKLLLEIAKNSPTETVKDHLTHTLALVEQIAAQIHDLSLNLRPPMLDDLGLLPALLGLFDHYTAQTGIEVIPEHRGVKNQRFTTEIETAAYRIVQEALTNVARHAGVNRVVVRLWVIQNILGVQIEDRGVGFELESAFASRTSSGLSGMRERVTLLGGHFEVESKAGVGTTLTAQLHLS